MTLESKQNRNRYIGNGATKVFPFTFKVWEKDHVAVIVGNGLFDNDVTSSCDIEISSTGGSVTFRTAPASGIVIVIKRTMPYIQEDDYKNGTRFDSEEIEDRFDQDCAERQDLLSGLDRCLKVPETSAADGSQLVDAMYQVLQALAETGEVTGAAQVIASGASAAHSLRDRFAWVVTPLDFGAKGDGVTDDTAAFTALEAVFYDKYINCLGLTYNVSTLPTGARYYNGEFQKDGVVYNSEYLYPRIGEFGVAAGKNAGMSVDIYKTNADMVAVGENAAKNLTFGRNCIAIGKDSLSGPNPGRHNIAIGVAALAHVNAPNSSSIDGSRNLCIGGNTGHFITTGNRNLILGRDAGHAITTGGLNISIGNGSMMGSCPNTPVPNTVVCQTPLTGYNNISIGIESLYWCNGSQNVCLGNYALRHVKEATGLVAIGYEAGKNLGIKVSPFGKEMKAVTIEGTFSQFGTSTVSIATETEHGLVSGGMVCLRFLDGELGVASASDDIWFYVDDVADSTHFTISTYPANGQTLTIPVRTDSGTMRISYTASASDAEADLSDCVFIGRRAGSEAEQGEGIVAAGSEAGLYGGDFSTFVGHHAGQGAIEDGDEETVYSAENNTFMGWKAGTKIRTGSGNVAVGFGALRYSITESENVALGSTSLCYEVGEQDPGFSFSNCVGLGAYTRCSDNYQVQLGTPEQTPYAYAELQVRSDARDKADVRDTILGLSFIKHLRPVDFKWDYRDDYFELLEDGTCIKHDKDGSKKRNRYHHGFLAQEVKAASDELEIDFGGFQDHSFDGGRDVQTIGYSELIAPIVKSIQELDVRIEALEG